MNQLLPSQHGFLTDQSQLAIYRGGLGSGKTRSLGLWAIKRAGAMGRLVLLIEPTYPMVEDVLIPTFEELLDLYQISGKIKKNRPEVAIGKGKILMRSGEKPDRLRGPNYHDFGIDEAPYLKDDSVYKVGIGRTRKDEIAQHRIVGTPKGRDWVYKLQKKTNCNIYTQSTLKNPFLPLQYRKNLMANYSGQFADQELKGDIVDFGSGFFDSKNIEIVRGVKVSHMCQAFDLGFTEKKASDYSAHALCAIGTDGYFYILHVDRWKFKAPETKAKIKSIMGELPEMQTLIEANGPQRAVYDDLVSDRMRVQPVITTTSKVARSVGFASAVNSGTVKCKQGAWLQDLFDELDEFSIDDSHSHDDMIDAVVMCYNELKFGNSGGLKSNW